MNNHDLIYPELLYKLTGLFYKIHNEKSKKFITKEDYNQMLRYLDAAKIKLGLIVNFRSTYLKPKRIINSKLASFV